LANELITRFQIEAARILQGDWWNAVV
jgi:hypothetical protein